MKLFDSLRESFHGNKTDRSRREIASPDAKSADAHPAKGSGSIAATTAQSASRSNVASARSTIKWRVLFVGGDAAWFRRIESELDGLQPDWACHHAVELGKIEAALDAERFDGLVVDGGIPEVDSILGMAGAKTSGMICLVRCDVTDRTTVAHWNRSGMTPLSFEADAGVIAGSFNRTTRLRTWMSDPAIKRLLPVIRILPTAPRLHEQVTEQLQSPNSSIQSVASLISQDPVMSAKILQVVNSALFGSSQEVLDTAEAVMVLGTERIRSLILLAGVFSQYGDCNCPGFSPEPIWAHSLQTAMLARSITFGETRDPKEAETAFTAGLLHDIGKLVLASNVPDMYATVRRMQASKRISLCEAERMILGTTHAELGACLLGTWGLPLSILEAIAWHHDPGKRVEKGFSLLAATHAANVMAHEGGAEDAEGEYETIHVEFLLRMGLGDCRNRWREFCGIPPKSESAAPEERVRQQREAKQN